MQYLSYENYLSICIDFLMEFVRFVSVLFLEVRSSKKAVLFFCGCISCKKIVPSHTSLFVQCTYHLFVVILVVFFVFLLLAIKKGESYKKTNGD